MKHKLFAITTAAALLVGGALGVSRVPAAQAQCLSGGTTIYVDPSAGGTGTGTSWHDAFTYLQEALYCAEAGQQIWVAEGTYKPTNGTDRNISFNMISGVAIYGGFPSGGSTFEERDWLANETILSGEIGDVSSTLDNSYHIVRSNELDTSAVLDGFTVTAGRADDTSTLLADGGGGIRNENSSARFSNLIIRGNYGFYGGGMSNISGSPIIDHVTFSENEAGRGGGLYDLLGSPNLNYVNFQSNTAIFGAGALIVGSHLNMTSGTFENNSADFGGGIENNGGNITIENVTFANNSAFEGGGCYINGGNIQLTEVSFDSNSAVRGGGVTFETYDTSGEIGALNFVNVTFNNNSAEHLGGGMYNYHSASPNLNNVTFSGNSAGESGGGMYSFGGGEYGSSSSPSLENVTFTGNSAGVSGGGMVNNDASSPSLEKVTFTNNEACGAGGGMFNWNNSSPTLLVVDFTGNTANIGAGMLNEDDSNPSLINVSFIDNSARLHAGGMANALSDPALVNVLFRGNSAPGDGGAMANRSSSPSLTNVTMVDNTGGSGGGMDNSSGIPSLRNTILWGNTATDGNQILNSSGASPSIRNSLIEGSGGSGTDWDTSLGTDGGGNLKSDPLFVDASSGDLHLQPGSPAIDAGDNATPGLSGVAGDLDGNPRIVDGNRDGMAVVDIGAYEAPTPPDTQGPLVTALSATPNPAALGQTVALSAALDDSTTGGSGVAFAEYSLDGGVTWAPLAAAGGGSFSATLSGLAVGVYNICARGADSVGNVGPMSCTMLAVYNPDGGFITGSGQIESPACALAADPDLEGRAMFGFVSRYTRGATRPTGSTSFRFHVARFTFDSTLYDWLVVNRAGSNAQFKGEGTVNGSMPPSGVPYKFMIWAGDASPDTFRIRIWWEDASGTQHGVYDNGSAQPISGGNIIIH